MERVNFNDVLDVRQELESGDFMKQLNEGTFYKKRTSVEEAARHVRRRQLPMGFTVTQIIFYNPDR